MKNICMLLALMASATLAETSTNGTASYYSDSYEGKRCADGTTVFHQRFAYAAHLTLPFGTRVRVTNLDNGKSWVVTIVDRGPYDPAARPKLKPHPTRVIDVSREVARMLGMLKAGVVPVRLEILPDRKQAKK